MATADTCPTGSLVKGSAWFGWADRAAADGTFEPTLRNAAVAIVGLMKLLQGFEHRDRHFKVDPGTQEQRDAVRSKPAIRIEGMRDKVLLAKYFIPMFEAAFPGSSIHRLENASHFLQEDEPEEIARLIIEFINKTAK